MPKQNTQEAYNYYKQVFGEDYAKQLVQLSKLEKISSIKVAVDMKIEEQQFDNVDQAQQNLKDYRATSNGTTDINTYETVQDPATGKFKLIPKKNASTKEAISEYDTEMLERKDLGESPVNAKIVKVDESYTGDLGTDSDAYRRGSITLEDGRTAQYVIRMKDNDIEPQALVGKTLVAIKNTEVFKAHTKDPMKINDYSGIGMIDMGGGEIYTLHILFIKERFIKETEESEYEIEKEWNLPLGYKLLKDDQGYAILDDHYEDLYSAPNKTEFMQGLDSFGLSALIILDGNGNEVHKEYYMDAARAHFIAAKLVRIYEGVKYEVTFEKLPKQIVDSVKAILIKTAEKKIALDLNGLIDNIKDFWNKNKGNIEAASKTIIKKVKEAFNVFNAQERQEFVDALKQILLPDGSAIYNEAMKLGNAYASQEGSMIKEAIDWVEEIKEASFDKNAQSLSNEEIIEVYKLYKDILDFDLYVLELYKKLDAEDIKKEMSNIEKYVLSVKGLTAEQRKYWEVRSGFLNDLLKAKEKHLPSNEVQKLEQPEPTEQTAIAASVNWEEEIKKEASAFSPDMVEKVKSFFNQCLKLVPDDLKKEVIENKNDMIADMKSSDPAQGTGNVKETLETRAEEWDLNVKFSMDGAPIVSKQASVNWENEIRKEKEELKEFKGNEQIADQLSKKEYFKKLPIWKKEIANWLLENSEFEKEKSKIIEFLKNLTPSDVYYLDNQFSPYGVGEIFKEYLKDPNYKFDYVEYLKKHTEASPNTQPFQNRLAMVYKGDGNYADNDFHFWYAVDGGDGKKYLARRKMDEVKEGI